VILWRDRTCVQLELGPRRIVLDDVTSDQLAAVLPRRLPSDPGRRRPVRPGPDIAELRAVLDEAGFLVTGPEASALQAAPARHGPEHAALAERIGGTAGAVLAARAVAAVAVHGTSRLAPTLASTLAAAGVGWVQLLHGSEVGVADACPGGLCPSDEGRRFGIAAVDAVRRAAPEVDTTPIPRDRAADLVLLTDSGPIDSTVRAAMHLDGLAHLACRVRGSEAVVGPLVIPGVTSCLRCVDLHRTDRDPAWPALAVQFIAKPRYRAPSDVSLCMATAGIAAVQALAYLDRQQPATLEGTLEWRLPDWRVRRRSWPAHHGCDCGASTRRRPRANRRASTGHGTMDA
jgi:hypothetical protein